MSGSLDEKIEGLIAAAAEAQHKRYCRICEDALDRLDCRQLKRLLCDARSLASSVREETREEAIRAQCHLCAAGVPAEKDARGPLWFHVDPATNRGNWCAAAAIRALHPQQGKKEELQLKLPKREDPCGFGHE